MILFTKRFWFVVGSTVVLLAAECFFALLMLLLYLALYMGTGYEPLNTFVGSLIFKGVAIIPVLAYNLKKIVTSYRQRDYLNIIALVSITGIYVWGIATSGGGGGR